MKVIDQIKNAKESLFSFELLPPVKGNSIEKLYNAIDPLMEFNPININITYHQHEVTYKSIKNNLIEKKIVRKRPGTVAISAAIKHKYNITVVPHLICGAFTREETEDALIDLNYLEIHNLLALRGDPPRGEKRFIPEPDGNAQAIDLVKQIVNMNKGVYMEEGQVNTNPTDFSVAVAGYPEKHFEAPNMKSDMQYLKEKVEAGADYIVTQMFFNNKKYFDFVDLCRAEGIKVPIIPGIKPITFLNDLHLLPQTFNIEMPDELVSELKKCKDTMEARQVGIEWGIEQAKELKAKGVPVIHFYSLGVSDNVRAIASEVF